ncbi:von Willebrand factor type A domain-containing protein [Chryseolinea sp. T2]|uniref:vWA domain-containing protein n=1 Tax=Chryseolinea sp. T2 TaxID=3129255 RepID=UPI003078749D
MKNTGWIMMLVLVVSSAFTTAPQTRTITGRVVDSDGTTGMPGINVTVKKTTIGTATDAHGNYQINVPLGSTLVFSFVGYQTIEVKTESKTVINVTMTPDNVSLNEVVVISKGHSRRDLMKSQAPAGVMESYPTMSYEAEDRYTEQVIVHNTEEYDAIHEIGFRDATKNPLSTFSIDVDAASYANMRRYINNGQTPPKDAVRIEELVNYFDYDYRQPTGEHPFEVITEVSAAPWNTKHRLVHIGLQGKTIPTKDLPASNLVFLIDVSGSMSDVNKLPLLKSSLKMLVEQLRDEDHVAIVVYAGAAGLVLEPTSGANKKTIINALDRLEAGGSTAGGEGIELAYATAKKYFKSEGNNRVILATDGDFNVGESSDAAMERLIEKKREEGIFLTVLGYGMGNYKDSKMEVLADKGNGNYAYIDNITEARKVLVNEFGGTLFTIAKDVKLQIEFNPANVKAYRLIGYENRMLASEDFNNDKKDAGELGSGHTVTALYEIVPVGADTPVDSVDPLKYQKPPVRQSNRGSFSNELMTIKLRYKKPDGVTSKLITHTLNDNETAMSKTSDNFRWSAAVAGFGMILRQSEYVNGFTYGQVLQLASSSKGADKEGYRIEFINLVKAMNPGGTH